MNRGSKDLNVNLVKNDSVMLEHNTLELCRLCANTDNQLIPIYKGEGLEHDIPVKLKKHLPIIEITEFDKLPLQICYQCASTLLAWHNLYEGCSLADDRLRKILAVNENNLDVKLDYGNDFQNDVFDEFRKNQIDDVDVLQPITSVAECEDLQNLNNTENDDTQSSRNIISASEGENDNIDRFTTNKMHNEQRVLAEHINNASSNSSSDHRDQFNGYNTENAHCGCLERDNEKCSLCVERDNLRCNFCPMVFIDMNKVERHLRTYHADMYPAKDTKRKSDFSSLEESKRTKLIRPTGILHPEPCGGSIVNEDYVTDKLYEKSSHPGFKCGICLKICVSSRGLTRHSAVHNKDNKVALSCNYCSLSFADDNSKQKHISEYHRIKSEISKFEKENESQNLQVQENSPSETITKIDNRLEVERIKDNERIDVIVNELLKTKIFTCSICNESFDKKQTLVRHQDSHNETGEFACEQCDQKFTDSKLLRRHRNSSHRKARVKTSDGDDPFIRWYVYADGQKHLKCDQCKYNSLWYHKGRFLEHYRIHTGEKPFMCDLCKKQFRTKTLLSKHVMFVHEGVKDHACDICGRRFSDKRYMEDHRRIHTGERPYVCDLCGKTFKQSASLFIHKELHKGLRKHHCDMCGKAFTTRSSLTIHIKRHVGERNFVCATCGKAFVDGKHLRDHMAVHSEDRPFGCDLCGSRFKLLKHLKQHGRTHKRNPFII